MKGEVKFNKEYRFKGMKNKRKAKQRAIKEAEARRKEELEMKRVAREERYGSYTPDYSDIKY